MPLSLSAFNILFSFIHRCLSWLLFVTVKVMQLLLSSSAVVVVGLICLVSFRRALAHVLAAIRQSLVVAALNGVIVLTVVSVLVWRLCVLRRLLFFPLWIP